MSGPGPVFDPLSRILMTVQMSRPPDRRYIISTPPRAGGLLRPDAAGERGGPPTLPALHAAAMFPPRESPSSSPVDQRRDRGPIPPPRSEGRRENTHPSRLMDRIG